MATKATPKTPKTPKTPELQTPELQTPNALGNMAQALTTPSVPMVSAHAAMLAKAQAVNNLVTVAGTPVRAANNVAARSASINAPLPATMASASYSIAKAPKLRVAYTQTNWPPIAASMAVSGTATGAQLQAAGVTADFVKYALKSGWITTA